MDLPRKDKYGVNILSYSQINTFKRDKHEYYETYILNKPFVTNPYVEFGNKVGEALEKNDFTNFTKQETVILKKVTRLDVFERFVKLTYNDFYLVGYVDTNDFDIKTIIDYKTGGLKKEKGYQLKDYTQLQIYALSLMQETGIQPQKAFVEFIRRSGNLYKGESLIVANEEPIKIEIDINYNNLKKVYWEILETAKQIDLFYSKIKENELA
jgi:hypothetical protein